MIPFSVKGALQKTLQEQTGAALAVARRRRRGGAEVMATPKMGSLRSTEAKGGGGMAGGGLWRRGEGERRPAVGTKGGGGARVSEGKR